MSGQEEKNEEIVETAEPSIEEEASAAEENGQAEVEAEEVAQDESGDDLAEQLAKAQEELREQQERVLRMAAELENFKKRMQRERESALKFAEENILKELLPSIDNLERAIEQGQNSDDIAALLEGVEMTNRGLLTTLDKFGVKSLEAAGQTFDPNFHEALAMEHSDEVDENLILQEFQKGYMFKDRLIRAAKVVVSKGKAEE